MIFSKNFLIINDKIEKEFLLRDLYYSPKTGYRSPQHLWELAKKEDPGISQYFVKQWLLTQSSYTRFKKWNNPRHYRHTMVRDFDQLQMDLTFMGSMRYTPEIVIENEGYWVILTAIEILSRYAFAYPLKSKTSKDVVVGVKEILKEFKERFDREPKFIQFDDGKEFKGDVEKYLDELDITHFTTYSHKKASIVERLNRTLRSKTMRMFEKNENNVWVEFLDDIIENYNDTVHSSIGMKPKDVNEDNKFTVWGRLFGHIIEIKKPKYKVGDRVRVVHLNIQYRPEKLKAAYRKDMKYEKKEEVKKVFGDFFKEKYKDNDPEKLLKTQDIVSARRPPFSREIFYIDEVLLGDPNVYKLYSQEFKREVMGIFYEDELSLVSE